MHIDLTKGIKEKARELGFSMAGVVEAVPGRRLNAYFAWLENEYHGQMGYLSRPDRLSRRRDLNVIMPGVRSLICVAMDYASSGPPDTILADPSRGRIASYAWGDDYHQVMLPRLEELAHWLSSEAGVEVTHRTYVDTGALMERDHAESAGLGFTGKNTMLITPSRGSWFFLGELLTTAALHPDILSRPMPGCGTCTRCLNVCPTDAFPEPYVLDARRCISYLTIELKDWIPRSLRPLMGNWIYGCDLCQTVCPFNRFAPDAVNDGYLPDRWEDAAPLLLDLMTLNEMEFTNRYSSSPIRRIGRARLVRNACVAAGNWGSEQALPVLIRLLADSSPLVRGHAAWALGTIGDENAIGALTLALAQEVDSRVRQEIGESLS